MARSWTDLAVDAVDRGFAATDGEGVRWFERAHRLSPGDPTVLYAWASALYATAPERALALLERLPRHRHVRLLSVLAWSALGRHAEAASALDDLLRNFAPPRTAVFRDLADRICVQAGYAGWIGVTTEGSVHVAAPGLTLWLGTRILPGPHAEAGEWRLPAGWRRIRFLTARSTRGRVAGARIDLRRFREVHGHVGMTFGRVLQGWALAPADPDMPPVIEVCATARGVPIVTARTQEDFVMARHGPSGLLGRAFSIPLPGNFDPDEIHVRAQAGAALSGSPVRLAAEARAVRQALGARADPWRPLPVGLSGLLPPRPRAMPQRRAVAIAVVVGDADRASIIACCDSLRLGAQPGARLALVHRNVATNRRKFASLAASVGACLLATDLADEVLTADLSAVGVSSARDLLVVDGATLLPPGATARLAAAAYADASTGTVTPLNTDGSLTSRLGEGQVEAPLAMPELTRIDDALQAAVDESPVPLPSCGTSCVYIRHDCLAEIGPIRIHPCSEVDRQLTDFAQRASHAGWSHRAAANVLVSARPGRSAPAMEQLPSDAGPTLHRLHPGLESATAARRQTDPLRSVRFALAARLWASGRRAASTVLVTHDAGGGVERHIAGRVDELRAAGRRPMVVRPGERFVLSDGSGQCPGNLVFATVEELAAFLGRDQPTLVELHHIAAHHGSVSRLAGLLRVPFDVYVHDFAALCPRVTLYGGGGQYCGEPRRAFACEDCIADHGARIPLPRGMADYLAEQATVLRLARRIVAPSRDTADRVRRFVSRVEPVVEPWEDDDALSSSVRRQERRPDKPREIAVTGAIGDDKGYRVLLACARDAARRDLPLHFIVIGHTIDDDRLLATGRVFVTGPFAEGEAPELARRYGAQLGLLPSVWPETWCYSLSALWQAGLYVVAFDLGAQAERIRQTGAGALLPLATPPNEINDYLLRSADSHSAGSTPEPRAIALAAMAV
jgi:glycosyltransferase involved in cell wall biosynthesis